MRRITLDNDCTMPRELSWAQLQPSDRPTSSSVNQGHSRRYSCLGAMLSRSRGGSSPKIQKLNFHSHLISAAQLGSTVKFSESSRFHQHRQVRSSQGQARGSGLKYKFSHRVMRQSQRFSNTIRGASIYLDVDEELKSAGAQVGRIRSQISNSLLAPHHKANALHSAFGPN